MWKFTVTANILPDKRRQITACELLAVELRAMHVVNGLSQNVQIKKGASGKISSSTAVASNCPFTTVLEYSLINQ